MSQVDTDQPATHVNMSLRQRIRDTKFLAYIGGFLALLGVLLTIRIPVQRYVDTAPETTDFFDLVDYASLVATMALIIAISYGSAALLWLMIGERVPKSFIRYLAIEVAAILAAIVIAVAIVKSVALLIYPVQAAFALIACVTGFALLITLLIRKMDTKST